jgi:hypothetical protein
LFGNTAHEQVTDGAATVSAHDDEVDGVRPRVAGDCLGFKRRQ